MKNLVTAILAFLVLGQAAAASAAFVAAKVPPPVRPVSCTALPPPQSTSGGYSWKKMSRPTWYFASRQVVGTGNQSCWRDKKGSVMDQRQTADL